MDLAKLTKDQLLAKATRATKALATLRELAESGIVHARHDAETVGAAVLMGGIRGAFEATGKDFSIPGPGGMKIPPEMPLGLLFLGLGFSGKTDADRDFHSIGSGILAYSGGREAENFMKTRQAKKAANGGNE